MTTKLIFNDSLIVIEAFKQTSISKNKRTVNWLIYKPLSFADEFPILNEKDVTYIPVHLQNYFNVGMILKDKNIEIIENKENNT